VIGIGLNVRWAPEGAARLGEAVDPFDVLAELLLAYDRLPVDIWPAYRAALATLGRTVRVERPGGVIEGRAVDVGRDGRLVVIDECAMSHHIDTGDVIHLRPAGPV
jgi:BirA family biotin operon repressor/biotin-[acetyl-CoA-carboxylase] ligase